MKQNFLGVPQEFSSAENSRYAIIPLPYNGTATWIKGADKGPEAVIQASQHVELFNIETGMEAYRRGIHTYDPVLPAATPEATVEKIKKTFLSLFQSNSFPIAIGGEHSVSIGIIKALAQTRAAGTGSEHRLTVLQLDAHADLRDSYDGSKYNHACVMARVKEYFPVVHCGIRSMDRSEMHAVDRSRLFLAHDLLRDSVRSYKQILKNLGRHVYITIDVDVFDPGIMPSTGTPEPGGLNWYTVTGLLALVFKQCDVVGCDVVELCPNGNHSAEFLAAKLVYTLISYHAHKELLENKWRENDEKA
ncbi:MAG: agmatinase [Spirochaetales bacterium]|nr:agmatinase [Spirochaetales bacterium]